MTAVDVRPVRTRSERRTFLTFPWRVYRGDPLWVPPLLPSRARVIDPKRGSFFERGQADFFVAWRGGEPVGTICAAEDPPTNAVRQRRECIFGFFEYLDDGEAADALVRRAADWARQRGLDALYGPYNLDYEDSYGVLLEGRDRPPALLCGHSPPYYAPTMDRLGFEPARADNLAFAVDLHTPQRDRLARVADKVRARGRVRVRQADLSQWDREIDRVHSLLNVGLAHLGDFIGWHRSEVEATLAQFRSIADLELVLFAEVDGETVGWVAAIPNLNEHLIHANGLRYPWDYARLAWRGRRRPECLCLKSVVVLPEYWNRGVGIVLFDELARRAIAKGYRWADLSVTSADNPATPLLAEHMGATIYKRWRVYRLPLELPEPPLGQGCSIGGRSER